MTSPLSSISGLISGINYQDLVDQIIQVEALPATRLRNNAAALGEKVDVLKTYRTLLDALKTASKSLRDGTAFEVASTTVAGATAPSGRTTLSAVARAAATPASYEVEVLALAQAEKLSGAAMASSRTALGLEGDFFVNGVRVTVAATDTLDDVRAKLAAANTGPNASKVSASVLTTGGTSRLVLTSDRQGAAGIDLVDGTGSVLRGLGLLDESVVVKHATSAGMQSDRFASSTTAIGELRGLTAPTGPQTVTIAGQPVEIDLTTDSLASIAARLNGLAGVTATVASETVDGATRYYLDVRAPSGVSDAGRALELLGFVTGGRSAVAQTVRGASLTAGDGTTPATAATALADLWNGGAPGGAAAGDTLSISGTRGDGTAVTFTYTIGAGDTVQDLLDALNDPETGFGGGSRPATASIDAEGRIVLTDGTAGDSRLSLAITARNESGGRLDLGTFETAEVGRQRVLAAGSDAVIRVDGITVVRSSNTIADAVPDLTLTLQHAAPGTVATVTVERSSQGALSALQQFVDGYNKIVDLIKQQSRAGAEGTASPPLYNDALLRLGRSALPQGLLATITGAAADLATAASAGLSLGADGRLTLDQAKFEAAYKGRYDDVRRLFMEHVTASAGDLTLSSTGGTAPGARYAIEITTAAAKASVTGSGFSGTYVDDGTPDRLVIADAQGGGTVSIALVHGMTAQQIADALDAAFSTAERREITHGATLYADPAGTEVATAAARLADLRLAGGAPAGVAAGDTITFSGTRPDGTTYSGTFTVTDPATQTLGDLASALQAELGSGAQVSVQDGRITVRADRTGPTPLALTLTAGNEGGGALDFGGAEVTAAGRNVLALEASVVDGQLVIEHEAYGSAAGFTLSFEAGGADGTAQLGLAAGARNGVDVAGTIDGVAALGVGQELVAAAGSAAEGLAVRYTGTAPASRTLDVVIGVGARMERLLDSWLRKSGQIDAKQAQLERRAEQLNARADTIEARLELRRAALLRQYAQMEVAIARLKQQASSLLALAQSSNDRNTA